MGMLDATMVVNGPEDVPAGWDAVDWRAAEENVRCLRQRIFTASQAGDLRRVRNLQKLMLRSRSAALLSVRRVTEVNAGRKTAGVDGRVVLAGGEKAGMAAWLQRGAAAWRPLPVKRVYHPESGRETARRWGFPRKRHSAGSSDDRFGFCRNHPSVPSAERAAGGGVVLPAPRGGRGRGLRGVGLGRVTVFAVVDGPRRAARPRTGWPRKGWRRSTRWSA